MVPLSIQHADGLSSIKFVKGKFTSPADYRPFGGEEVGKFKMKMNDLKDMDEINELKLSKTAEVIKYID